jgi:manganese oxidase
MFTLVKVREGLARDDYKDPGWYQQPAGTRAYEWTGAPLAETKAPSNPAQPADPGQAIVNVTRGSPHGSH